MPVGSGALGSRVVAPVRGVRPQPVDEHPVPLRLDGLGREDVQVRVRFGEGELSVRRPARARRGTAAGSPRPRARATRSPRPTTSGTSRSTSITGFASRSGTAVDPTWPDPDAGSECRLDRGPHHPVRVHPSRVVRLQRPRLGLAERHALRLPGSVAAGGERTPERVSDHSTKPATRRDGRGGASPPRASRPAVFRACGGGPPGSTTCSRSGIPRSCCSGCVIRGLLAQRRAPRGRGRPSTRR